VRAARDTDRDAALIANQAKPRKIMPDQDSVPAASTQRSTRKRWLIIVAGTCAAIAIAYGAYWAVALRYLQSTDDAYVNGNVVQVTSQIAGTVVAIDGDDTQFVNAGQAVVKLDQADAQVALDAAEAQLARTVREVRGLFATSAQLQASVAVRQSELDRATDDLGRRERLATSGAVSGEELQHARDSVDSAKAALLAAQQQLEANRARVDRTTIDNNPEVKSAITRVRDAYLMLARTTLPAPVSGFVAKRTVQLGQRVSPGAPLMSIVPLNDVWVDANFKEPQLASMRVGQPVTLTADIYGSKVPYHGRVVGFGAGTGSAFALLPAQNASGNWIKVVQRVPVRIALDARELAAHPLQVGLSMQVEVDTHERGGDRLPQVAQPSAVQSTQVFQSMEATADARIKSIIAANAGAPTRSERALATHKDGTLARPAGLGIGSTVVDAARDHAL
jgi:membrane fusion protein (multidrug efflux system)